MNLYAVLSDPSCGDDTWAMLAVAPTRGRARHMIWGQFGEEGLHETRYVVRLVQKDVEGGARIIDSAPDAPDLWALSREKTGIYQRAGD